MVAMHFKSSQTKFNCADFLDSKFLQDWISITYLFFYTSVLFIIVNFMAEMNQERLYQTAYLTQSYVPGPNVTINQTFLPFSPPHPSAYPTTPPGYPHSGTAPPPPYTAWSLSNISILPKSVFQPLTSRIKIYILPLVYLFLLATFLLN